MRPAGLVTKEGFIGRLQSDFQALLPDCDKGLFITTGTFTADARKEATRDGAAPIDLVDGDRLCDLLKNMGIGVNTELVEQVDIDRDRCDRV